MLNIEEAARLGAIDDLVEGVGLGGGCGGVEGNVLSGEMVPVREVVAAGLVANVLVGGASVLLRLVLGPGGWWSGGRRGAFDGGEVMGRLKEREGSH